MLHASPCCMSVQRVHIECPYSISMLHVLAAVPVEYPCCMPMSMLNLMSLQHVFEIINLHVHAACLYCLPMLHFHAVCPCCFSKLHVHAIYTCLMSFLHVFAACPCCMSLPHVLPACPCRMYMPNVYAASFTGISSGS